MTADRGTLLGARRLSASLAKGLRDGRELIDQLAHGLGEGPPAGGLGNRFVLPLFCSQSWDVMALAGTALHTSSLERQSRLRNVKPLLILLC